MDLDRMYRAEAASRAAEVPQNRPRAHEVGIDGQSVGDVASHYGVTPEAIQEANPDLFGQTWRHGDSGFELYRGDVLTIPPAPMSVTEDPISSDFNPIYSSPNSEFTASGENGGITWNPGDGSVKLTQAQEIGIAEARSPQTQFLPGADAPGNLLQFTVLRESAVANGVVNKDGNTEVTVEVDASLALKGSAETTGMGRPPIELEGSVGGGVGARYKVTLPGENRNPAAAAAIDPFDPTTIPVGASVTMDAQDYTKTELAGSFNYIGFKTNAREATGTSWSVTRVDATTVRVTMGPNQAVEAFNGMGVGIEGARVMVGRQDNLGESKLGTAEFDLSNPDGQAAYAHFVATGEVAHETPGVSNVAMLERTDHSSQRRLQVELGPFAADLAGQQNTGSWVKTVYPDGSYAMTMQLQYSGQVPLTVTQRFDAQGNEVQAERIYRFEVKVDESNAGPLNWVLSGGVSETGPAVAGQTMTLTMSEAQVQSLMGQTRAAADTFGSSSTPSLLAYDLDGRPQTSSLQFAVGLVRGQSGEAFNFASTLLQISDAADGKSADHHYQRIDARTSGG